MSSTSRVFQSGRSGRRDGSHSTIASTAVRRALVLATMLGTALACLMLVPSTATAQTGESTELNASADGVDTPSILTPPDGTQVPYGYTGPVSLDMSGGTGGYTHVAVKCDGGYNWWLAGYRLGTDPAWNDFEIPPIHESGSSCRATLELDDVVVDTNTFTTGPGHGGSLQIRLATSSSIFYPTVKDGYRDKATIRFTLSGTASPLIINARRQDGRMFNITGLAEPRAGTYSYKWNGQLPGEYGPIAKPGKYDIVVVGTDQDGVKTKVSTPIEVAPGPPCVSKSEFRRVHKGMTPHRVARLFGTNGSFGDGGAGGYSRLYPQCNNRQKVAAVEFSILQPGPARADGWKRWGL